MRSDANDQTNFNFDPGEQELISITDAHVGLYRI